MIRIKRTFLTLLIVFVLSFSSVFAADISNQATASSKQQTAAAANQVGVIKVKGNYYYRYPVSKKIRQKAGFITWDNKLYYIRSGGMIISGQTFKLGDDYYRACLDGSIARGIYKWGDKLYYSDPETGKWVTVKSVRFETYVKWKGNAYYIMKGGEIATNRPVVIKNHPFMALKNGACVKMDIAKPNNQVIKVAQSQVGIMTGRKYWRWYFGTRFIDTDRTPWCGCFTAWCYNQANQYGRISKVRRYGNLGYVPSYIRWANSYHKWINKKYARGGDIIVFGRSGRHVAIVENVYKGYIFTVEGNSGPTSAIGSRKPGAVTRRVYALDDPDIKGVIRP